ncbi:hypothetical protein BLNAU_18852 [Blattamonas nauphoetae]|uniref:Uncharacterized protein n=1 Tax=Blattamonas nauphoetae TaxID=2049346 RepID=A0ABQ9X3A4_9EUKA|nr:hypothetical protein BLNAU_18852 [Blattamonas nauphoetae]
MMILSTVQVFLLLCSVFQCVEEHYQDFDAVYEKKQTEYNLASNSELRKLSFDDGFYWTNGIEIISKSVELHGNKTGLTHRANVVDKRNRYTDETANGTPIKDTGVERWMMGVQNTSLTMRSFGLDAGMAGTTICLVVGSSVEVHDSDILSNMECSGFVLADVVGSGSSRIVIVGSSHKSSTRNVVLPLVGRGYGQLNKINEGLMGDEEGWSGGLVEREEIIGVELSFDSTHFVFGTGPLFSFVGKSLWSGSDHAMIKVIGEISTELRSSDIRNVTSSFVDGSGRRKSLGVGSCVWERVIGSRVSGSTNHDMGTGLCGTGLGFNVLCANSSFSSCVRTSNNEIDIERKNITQDHIGRTEVISPGIIYRPEMTNVKFTLSTFHDMTVAAESSRGGAAICLFMSVSHLFSVTLCSFHKCTCTGKVNFGAAIYYYDFQPDLPATISCCSFTECANTGNDLNRGGSLFGYSSSIISISHCFFENSTSSIFDGAISIWFPQHLTLSNCAFVSCSSRNESGAVTLYGVKKVDLSFIQFRGSSSERMSYAKDIFFKSISASLITEETVRFCDSTSGSPNAYQDRVGDVSDLVPQLDSTPTVTVEVSISEGTATVTATASEEVKGTMGILLNGSNVPRLVHVQFGSNSHTSRSGSTAVSSGDDGVLPPADYEVYASSMPSNYLSSLRIRSAECSLKDVNTTTIVLGGMNLGSGSYSMLIRNGANTPFNISLTRSNLTTLVGEAPLYPLTAEGRLEGATAYDIEKVMWLSQGGEEENVRVRNQVTLTTPPEPTRLVQFTKGQYDDKMKTIGFVMTGRALDEEATYKVVLSASDTVNHTIEMTCKSNGKWEGSAVLYPSTDAELVYGTTYTVSSFMKGTETDELLRDDQEAIEIMTEPVRLVSTSSAVIAGKNGTTLTLTSRSLSVGSKYSIAVVGTPTVPSASNEKHTTTLMFTATSATLNTVPLTLYPFEDAIVEYGHTYSVEEMKVVDGASILVETEDCVFETPKEPARIISFKSVSLNGTKATITFEGRVLTEDLCSIWVSFGTTFWKSSLIRNLSETLCEVDFQVAPEESETSLKYEGEYTACIKPLETSSLLVDSGISVRLPPPPSFTNVEFKFTNLLGTECFAILTGKDLVIETEYEVTLDSSHTFFVVAKSSTRAESAV